MAAARQQKREGFDLPAMPLYVGDYLGSPRVGAMTLAQEGAYLRLLMYQWQDGSVPADIGALARLCRVGVREMKRLWIALEPCFSCTPQDPSRLANESLERKRAEVVAFRTLKAESGRAGAQKRWRRDGERMADPSEIDGTPIGSANSKRMAGGMANRWPSSSSRSSDPEKSERSELPAARARGVDLEPPFPESEDPGHGLRDEPPELPDAGPLADPASDAMDAMRQAAGELGAAWTRGDRERCKGLIRELVADAKPVPLILEAWGRWCADPFWRERGLPLPKFREYFAKYAVDTRIEFTSAAPWRQAVPPQLAAWWQRVTELIGARSFRDWLEPCDVRAERDGVITIVPPNPMVANWVVRNFLGMLQETADELLPGMRVEVRVQQSVTP